MTDMFSYRPNVAMLVYRPATGRLWLGERCGQPGHWQFPQGGVDAGETLEENVMRELTEELGAQRAFFGVPQRFMATHRYDFDAPRAYGPNIFRGQDQTFWAVPFLGKDSDLDLMAHEPEFQAWLWVTPLEVRQLAPKRRLIGYEPALSEFESLMLASQDKKV